MFLVLIAIDIGSHLACFLVSLSPPVRSLARENSFETLSNSNHNDCYEILYHLDNPSRWRPQFLLRILTDFASATDEALSLRR